MNLYIALDVILTIPDPLILVKSAIAPIYRKMKFDF